MSSLMAEALTAVEDKVELAPNKIPDGKTVIGIELYRDPKRSAKYVTRITKDWQVPGKAVALKDGHVVQAAHLFGRFSEGEKKVTACHWLQCDKCGTRVLMSPEVWRWKDYAREVKGVSQETLDKMHGQEILDKWGSCTCGGRWHVDREYEKDELTSFTDRVLRAVEAYKGTIPAFVQPTVFNLYPLGTVQTDLPQNWSWMVPPLSRLEEPCTPKMYDKDAKAPLLLFNPGFWIGVVDNADQTGFFWVEDGKERRRPNRDVDIFNVSGIEGL